MRCAVVLSYSKPRHMSIPEFVQDVASPGGAKYLPSTGRHLSPDEFGERVVPANPCLMDLVVRARPHAVSSRLVQCLCIPWAPAVQARCVAETYHGLCSCGPLFLWCSTSLRLCAV